MKSVVRCDISDIKASFTDEGFLKDMPIITRTGIFEYRNHDGSIRRELRPPEEILKEDSLASLKGKPIIVTHKAGRVDASNARKHTVGTILSEGMRDGDNVRAEIIIYDKAAQDSGLKQLSCGYLVDLEMTPGEWQGEKYDCIQRNVRYNHLALVERARAGEIARLNLDGDEIEEEFKEERTDSKMAKLRLDNGIEYEVAPEVEAEFNQVKTKLDGLQKTNDTVTAERDSLKSKLDEKDKEIEQVKKDSEDRLDSQVKERVELLQTAEKFNVDKADEMSNLDIKKAVVKAVRGDSIDLVGKSEVYIDAAFDMAKAEVKHDAAANQRFMINQKKENLDGKDMSSSEARNKMIDNMQKAYIGTDANK
ncbi:DUF2213 domain-containing protein [Anaerosolibacter sp.]|uniref:DUF2213 domain-containing protein n=1 Tax=Anaerosolibacter sp. TaxID=1872527 RepID=UPI0039EE19F5